MILSKVIVISFDRWHAGFLGCYGNPWVDSPHLDQFALNGTVFDRHFAENLHPLNLQHAWWTGRCQFPLSIAQQGLEPTWLPLLTASNIRSHLIYDTASRLPVRRELFDDSTPVDTHDTLKMDFEKRTPKSIKTAIALLKEMEQRPEDSELLWLHLGGLPLDQSSVAYDEFYADGPETEEADAEDDEPEQDEVDLSDAESGAFPPRFWRRNRSSPRELAEAQLRDSDLEMTSSDQRAWRRRRDLYSGQVTQWDAWIGRLLSAAKPGCDQTPTMIVFTAAAGQHLGEHPALGEEQGLFHEVIQVPLMVQIPLAERSSGRRHLLSHAPDLPATILDWLGVPPGESPAIDGISLLPAIREDATTPRDTIYVGSVTDWGVRTAEHYYHYSAKDEIQGPVESLFKKPGDRWDANNISRQYLDDLERWKTPGLEFITRIRSRAAGN